MIENLPTLILFIAVYSGMILGGYPGMALDRTGIALLGAILLLALGQVSLEEAWLSQDVPTLCLLFGLMVVSAQFRLGGLYAYITRKLAALPVGPVALLLAFSFISGGLSALLANDIVCLAMTPILIEGTVKRKLNPVPYLLVLACSANIGSAATLIGNPQNMLIGQTLELSFGIYFLQAILPASIGLIVAWAVISFQYQGKWYMEYPVLEVESPVFNLWQTSKGILVLLILVIGFLFSDLPREIMALAAAGFLLTSRRMATRPMLSLVDWHLLVLFGGLFVVNHALEVSGMLEQAMSFLNQQGVDVSKPGWLFIITAVLSNLVSNVPAVMLLLPVATDTFAGPVLALSSTLAGNLIIVGSIANIIVIDQAARLGFRISWWQHARTGIPITILTLLITAIWLYTLQFIPQLH